MESGHAAHDVVTVYDHFEDPRPEIVGEWHLATRHSDHGNGPRRRRHAEQTDQFVTRRVHAAATSGAPV